MARKGKKALPKKVAGVKISKKIRKVGGKARKLADDYPVIGEAAVAALLAAAAALADKEVGRDKAAGKARRTKRVLKAAAGAVGARLMEEVTGRNKADAKAARKAGRAGEGGQPDR